jgi:L-amino acid N-acyltransferase YncA
VRVYRTAGLDDLPGIVAIYNATVPSRMVTADLHPVTVDSRRAWFEAHRPDTRPRWVVEQEGALAAWLSFSSFYGRPAYSKTAELSVYVDPAWRGRGLGSYLLLAAVEHAPQIMVDRLLGFIFAHNTPSLALFAKCGFERWGLLPGVAALDGVERDLAIVGRRA